MADKSRGIGKAEEIYRNRSQRAGELKTAGKKIIGYPCIYVPVEMLTALDLVPYRTCADIKEPVTEADRALPASFCPIMRSCLDCAFKSGADFLDGIVAAHSCDPQEKTARVWQSYIDYPYFHFIDMPGTVRPEALEYFKGQLSDFKKTLESFAAKELSPDKLRTAIQAHNQQRALVRELYELTKPAPPLVSGTEILWVVKALMSLPVAEGNELLTQVIDEVRTRKSGPDKKSVRLLIWSGTVDDAAIMQILEAEANVVIDESCGGIRPYRTDIKLMDDQLYGLAHYYLTEITCARTFRETTLGETEKDYATDLQSRFGYLKSLVKEWRINGAILLLVRYCDPFAFEMTAIKDYLASLGIPSSYVEYDYTQGALAPLKTRVGAFIETIG